MNSVEITTSIAMLWILKAADDAAAHDDWDGVEARLMRIVHLSERAPPNLRKQALDQVMMGLRILSKIRDDTKNSGQQIPGATTG